MPQITFEESKFDEIIRLVTKDGWYKGNAKVPADLPSYLLEPRGKTKPGIPTLDEEITAFRKGYVEGMAARQEGKEGPDNPYSHDNVLKGLST